jgi:integrase
MSVYLVKGKGWRYDFTLKGERYTETWFKTKREGQQAEAKRREELKNPKQEREGEEQVVNEPTSTEAAETQTGITFLELVNLRLDFISAYKTPSYYKDNRYLFKRLVRRWGQLRVDEINSMVIQKYILERAKKSHYAANYDLRLLKALFNHGIKHKVLVENPVKGVPFLPVEKRAKFVPSSQDIDKVIALADPDTQDYLWTIRETMGRISEINRLTWDDVDLKNRYVTLYTRKKSGGHLTPRKVAMTLQLFEVLNRRHATRNDKMPWVFWHALYCRKTGEITNGPYTDRKTFMKTLCAKAGVRYFRFHAIRHSGASIMDCNNVPIGAIQRILGHENRTTTEIYLHGIGDMERAAIAVYEHARQNSHTNSHTGCHIKENGTQVQTSEIHSNMQIH